jgi:hypothetical protein
MSDTESEKRLITDEKIERLRAIFDPERKLEADEDLRALAQYVEDESDEASELVIDHDYDFGDGN